MRVETQIMGGCVMVDPITLALAAVLGSMGTEAGRSWWLSLGGLARRIAGREVSRRRTLIILDHASAAAQVEPFFTSAGGSFVIVVASRRLPDLHVPALQIDRLSVKDMELLLDRLLGDQAAVRAQFPALAEDCEGLPHLARGSVAELTEWLQRGGGAPAPVRFDSDGQPVRASVERSYRRLAPDAAWLLRALAAGPWHDAISMAAR
ncbi:hypothetical protein [Streptomyces sp. 6N223]|uniref:hypothetical protein n=1 Tax=Streptomyces sp. 6N223 TaxID=3457412 RepID=UPI003FD18010